MPYDDETNILSDQDALLASLRSLRDTVATEGKAQFRLWRERLHRPEAAGSMLNLAHYLALRHRDLRPLQDQLVLLGLSSLGRAESHVLASLDAVIGGLERLLGKSDGRPWPVAPRRFRRGTERLQTNADTLFGPTSGERTTRLMVTLPTEAAAAPDHVRRLIERGAEIVRINCAHDSAAEWIAMASHAREAGHACGREVPVLMDIAGPKLRTGAVHHPKHAKRLQAGDSITLVATEASLTAKRQGFAAVVDPAEILLRLKPDARIAIDDGLLDAQVTERRDDGSVVVRVLRVPADGYKLKPGKGLNFPGTELGLEPLSAKDLTDLDVIAAHADLVGHSFVNDAADVASLQAALAERRPAGSKPLGLIAKVETLAAINNLPEIIAQAAGAQPFGVMIARGDLAVEIGFPRVAEMQEEVLWASEAAHVPVIWATQVLESLVKTGLPTRGEMTDAAMSARAECVMLNKGAHVDEAIDILEMLLVRMAGHQTKKTPRLRALHSW